jgi:CDP-glucose 4,6-dehydratase
LAGLESELKGHTIGDIRHFDSFKSALIDSNADFAIHLAAQPLVLQSYDKPIETYTTNVLGTLNFLQIISELPKPPTTLVVTTDKVYRDVGKDSYIETDALGGRDPYSASKAMADLLTQSWCVTNSNLKLGIARAGNVIGAFDVSPNRLVPDIVRALDSGTELVLRNPHAIRPWQHVLDCLSGYLMFLFAMEEGKDLPTALNFGPDTSSIRDVQEVVARAFAAEPALTYRIEKVPPNMMETHRLSLDAGEAKRLLGWSNKIDFDQAVRDSVVREQGTSALAVARKQIRKFIGMSEYGRSTE